MKILFTDLDRTLLPNGIQPESPMARPLLFHLLATCGVLLVYASGRDIDRVIDAISDYSLPMPHIIVADVGAAIYRPSLDNDWNADQDWLDIISVDWHGLSGSDITERLKDVDVLTVQESNRQTPLKASFYYDLASDRATLEQHIHYRLKPENVSVSLIFSEDPHTGRGLLDVLPHSASKLAAISFVLKKLNVSENEVLFSGDSGNDLTALTSTMPSVLVANGDSVTQQAVISQSMNNNTAHSTYTAKGQLAVAGSLALNGNYAAGVLEGILHYQPQWGHFLEDIHWVNEAQNQYPVTPVNNAARSA